MFSRLAWLFVVAALCDLYGFLTPPAAMASEPTAEPAGANQQKQQPSSITVNGVDRQYFLHLPAGYDGKTPLPLILVFHGGGGRAEMLDKLTNWNALADQEQVIIVYPRGVDKHWHDGRGIGRQDVDDVGFIAALLTQLEKDYAVDKKRIYATGISNGGFFSQYLAIKSPGKLAGIASVAASTSTIVHDKETPSPTPILFILGMKDPLVPWNGGEIRVGPLRRGSVVSAAESADYWAKANHCSTPPVVTEKTFADGEKIVTKTFTPSPDSPVGADVVQIGIEDGGHCWPGGWQYLPARLIGKTSRNLQATRQIWEFFKCHQLH